MLDIEFLRSLGIREVLLPKGSEPRMSNGIGRNSEEETFDGPLGKPFAVQRDDLNRLVWDLEGEGRIESYEHADGLVLIIYPEDPEARIFGMEFSKPHFEKLVDDMSKPIEKPMGCRSRDRSCWYYLPPNFADLECLAKINRVAKH